MEKSTIELYRAVSQKEFEDIKTCGKFRICLSGCSMEDKWFAENLEDAVEWGKRFYFNQGAKTFYVVKASIPSELAKKMFYYENLDNIGNAICVSEDFLDRVKLLGYQVKRRKK